SVIDYDLFAWVWIFALVSKGARLQIRRAIRNPTLRQTHLNSPAAQFRTSSRGVDRDRTGHFPAYGMTRTKPDRRNPRPTRRQSGKSTPNLKHDHKYHASAG